MHAWLLELSYEDLLNYLTMAIVVARPISIGLHCVHN